MDITIQFEAQLRNIAGCSTTRLSVADACSVAEAIRIAAASFSSELGQRLVTSEGSLQRSVLLFVNDEMVSHDQSESHALKSADTILLYPPISGG